MSLHSSTIPAVAMEYMEAILETQEEFTLFLNDFEPKHTNIFMAIADFRLIKLSQRIFTIDDFLKLYEEDCLMAIQKLFLYPIYERSFDKYIINPIADGDYYLSDLYYYQKNNPNINPILAGKKLIHLGKLP